MLHLRLMERWRRRKDRGRDLHRRLHPDGSCELETELQVDRRGDFHGRHIDDGGIPDSGDPIDEILADLDGRIAGGPGSRTLLEAGRPGNDPVGLCGRAGTVELSYDGPADPRDVASSSTAEGFRDRQLLAALLDGIEFVEAVADRLIGEFGSLHAVLAAGRERRARIPGAACRVNERLSAVRAAMLYVLRTEALSGPILSTAKAVADYLQADMGFLREENLRVLYLNGRHELLRDEVREGSIDEAPLYPRTVLTRALEVGATGLIIIHNHPSGEAEPSRSDIRATSSLVRAASSLEVAIHDHLIVSRSICFSFREHGLL